LAAPCIGGDPVSQLVVDVATLVAVLGVGIGGPCVVALGIVRRMDGRG